MIQFITIIHVVVSVLLVIVILLQQGKKDGMGSAFGGGSQSVFGARGAETFLEKLTKGLAVIFMFANLGLVYFSSRAANDSLLNEKSAVEAPVQAPVAAPATTETPVVPPAATPETKPVK